MRLSAWEEALGGASGSLGRPWGVLRPEAWESNHGYVTYPTQRASWRTDTELIKLPFPLSSARLPLSHLSPPLFSQTEKAEKPTHLRRQ